MGTDETTVDPNDNLIETATINEGEEATVNAENVANENTEPLENNEGVETNE